MKISEWKNENGLYPSQSKALELLATETSLTKVANEVGISRQALWNWINHDENFRLRLTEQSEAAITAATSKWILMYSQAADVVKRAMETEDEISAQQLRAADVCVKRLPQLLEMTVIHSRLAALERMLLGENEHGTD